MTPTFQIIALSSLDPLGNDHREEPELLFPDALKSAQALKAQGKAFRVFTIGEVSEEQRRAFEELGAIDGAA